MLLYSFNVVFTNGNIIRENNLIPVHTQKLIKNTFRLIYKIMVVVLP